MNKHKAFPKALTPFRMGVFLLSFALLGCGGSSSGGGDDSSCTVTFDSRGGTAVASAEVSSGDTVAQPVDPNFSGYTFYGWSRAADSVDLWNFQSDVVTEDMTLYAKWAAADMIVNGDFKDGSGDNWTSYRNLDDGAVCTYTIEYLNNYDYYASLETTKSALTDSWDIQLFYSLADAISLKKGDEYELSFDAWCPEGLEMDVCLQEPNSDIDGDGSPWSNYYSKNIILKATKTKYTAVFTMENPDDDNAGLHFNLGYGDGTYCFYNVSLKRIQ